MTILVQVTIENVWDVFLRCSVHRRVAKVVKCDWNTVLLLDVHQLPFCCRLIAVEKSNEIPSSVILKIVKRDPSFSIVSHSAYLQLSTVMIVASHYCRNLFLCFNHRYSVPEALYLYGVEW